MYISLIFLTFQIFFRTVNINFRWLINAFKGQNNQFRDRIFSKFRPPLSWSNSWTHTWFKSSTLFNEHPWHISLVDPYLIQDLDTARLKTSWFSEFSPQLILAKLLIFLFCVPLRCSWHGWKGVIIYHIKHILEKYTESRWGVACLRNPFGSCFRCI